MLVGAELTDTLIRVAITAATDDTPRQPCPPHTLVHVPGADALVSRPVGVGGTHQYNDVRKQEHFACLYCDYVRACDNRVRAGKHSVQTIGHFVRNTERG